MATEFTVQIQDRPGELAKLTDALRKSGVNILALHATPCPDQGMVQFVTNNPDATVAALESVDIPYDVREVLLLRLKDEPEEMVRLATAIAEQGININALYVTNQGQVVLDTDNLSSAQQIAMSLGVT
jgi:hypothetical protein